jgi:uncharacterized protein
MATKIFVNLPVKDLSRSIAFFTEVGFTFNTAFTDESATCMILGENIFAMLMVDTRFKDFTKKELCNAHTHIEVILAIDAPSPKAVNELVAKALAAGGTRYAEPIDHGWMYYDSFADLDGHQWEVAFMDESQMPQG